MQARLGFKRPNRSAQIRLRPLDHQAAHPAHVEGGNSRDTSHLSPSLPNQPKNALQAPSPAYRRQRKPGKKQGEVSLSPPPLSALQGRDHSSDSREDGTRSVSPVTNGASRPVTALLPEQGNTTWTTFEGMTKDTVGAVLSEALREDQLPADNLQQVPMMEVAVAAAAATTTGIHAAGADVDLAGLGAIASSSCPDAPATTSPAKVPEATAPPPLAQGPSLEKSIPPKNALPETTTRVALSELATMAEIEDMAQQLLMQAYMAAPQHAEVAVARSMMCSPSVVQNLSGGGWHHMPSVGNWACSVPARVQNVRL